MNLILQPFLFYANTCETENSSLRTLFPGVSIPTLRAARREDRLAEITDPILRAYETAWEQERLERAVTQEADTREDTERLLEHLKDLQKWLSEARDCLKAGKAWDRHLGSRLWCFCKECIQETKEGEFLCLCARLTLLRDHYWASRLRARNYAYTYTPLLWVISLMNRLLRIRLLGQASVGSQAAADSFSEKGFPVPTSQRKDKISEWMPETIREALRLLVFAHSEGGVKVGGPLRTYWNAIQDRLAVLATEPFEHTDFEPAGLLRDCYLDVSEEAEEGDEVVAALQDDKDQALSRQIRNHVESEKLRVQAEAKAAGEQMREEEKHAPVAQQLQDVTRAQISWLREQLTKSGNEHIAEQTLSSTTSTVNPEERRKEEAVAAVKKALSGVKGKKIVRLKFKWAREMSLLADSISCWQQPPPSPLAPTVTRTRAEQFIRNEINRAAFLAEEKRFLQQSQDWCLARLLTVAERELYRLQMGGKTAMNPVHVVKSVRNQEFEQAWPRRLCHALLPANPMFPYVQAYAAWWWLQQSFPRIDIDSTIFFWDVQEEFLSFDRVTLESPVIAKVGGDWAVICDWGLEREMLARWFGNDLPAAVTFWALEVFQEREGTVYNYATGKQHDLSGSKLAFSLNSALS